VGLCGVMVVFLCKRWVTLWESRPGWTGESTTSKAASEGRRARNDLTFTIQVYYRTGSKFELVSYCTNEIDFSRIASASI
jgi:hypothetical protein